MFQLLLRILLILLCVCTAAKAAERDVSMVQLIANPQQYDGTPIRLIAFLNLEFEGNALYLHREDFERGLSKNAIWISLTDEQDRSSQKLSGGYVIVEGVFSAEHNGHLGMFSGSVEKVTRLSTWERGRARGVSKRSK